MESNFSLVKYFCHAWKKHFRTRLPRGQTINCRECGGDFVEIDEPTDPDSNTRTLVLPRDSNEVQSQPIEQDDYFQDLPRHRSLFNHRMTNSDHDKRPLSRFQSERSQLRLQSERSQTENNPDFSVSGSNTQNSHIPYILRCNIIMQSAFVSNQELLENPNIIRIEVIQHDESDNNNSHDLVSRMLIGTIRVD